MKAFKRMACIFLASTMLMGVVGCNDKKKDEQGSNSKKEASEDMKKVHYTFGDEYKSYFIDGNGTLKVYSGYNNMSDFNDGIAMVEVNNDDYSGYMLIDKDENVIVKAKEMEYFEYYRNDETIVAYRTINEERQSGIYGPKGEKIADFQYEYVMKADIDWAEFDVIVGKKEDTSVDIYSLDGKLVCNVPAGYAQDGYGFDGISIGTHRSEENILRIEYGDVVKLIRMDTYEELPVDKFDNYYNGVVITDSEIILYSNFEEVKKIAYDKESKPYSYVIDSNDGTIYSVEYKKGTKTYADVYNINGELIYSGENKFNKMFDNGDKSFYKYRNEEKGYVLIDSTGKEVFTTPARTDILTTNVDGIFYTKCDDEVKIYEIDTMKPYDDKVYKSAEQSGIFYGEEYNLIFNENGDSYKSKKNGDEQHYDCSKLPCGFYIYVADKDGERSKYIVDINGSKDIVKVPYEASINEDMPYYKIGNVYYGFNGKELLDIDKLKK